MKYWYMLPGRKWKWKSLSQLFATPWAVVHGISQARILEWVAFPFSRASSQPRSPTLQADSLPAEPPGKPWYQVDEHLIPGGWTLKILTLSTRSQSQRITYCVLWNVQERQIYSRQKVVECFWGARVGGGRGGGPVDTGNGKLGDHYGYNFFFFFFLERWEGSKLIATIVTQFHDCAKNLKLYCLENLRGQRNLKGYRSWDHRESDTTEWLGTHNTKIALYTVNEWVTQEMNYLNTPVTKKRIMGPWASLVAQLVRNPPAMWETWVWSLGWEDALEWERATHSSILAWRIP